MCSDVWHPVLPALVRRHEVFSVTFPGHMGGVALPEGFRYSVKTAVDYAEAELDAMGFKQVHIVGNSLGGWFALELARRGRALSVVAIAPGGGWEPGSAQQRRLMRKFRQMKVGLKVGGPLAPWLVRSRTFRRFALRDVVARTDRLTREQATLLIRAPWRCEVFDDIVRAMPAEKAPERLDPTPCPIRLVWGTNDRLLRIREYSDLWRRALPGADWVELEGVGHVPMYDDPDAVAQAILDFTAPQGQPSKRVAS